MIISLDKFSKKYGLTERQYDVLLALLKSNGITYSLIEELEIKRYSIDQLLRGIYLKCDVTNKCGLLCKFIMESCE